MHHVQKGSRRHYQNTRITKMRAVINNRAIEMLEIDGETPFTLEIGCGCGQSGSALSVKSYECFGMDISPEMLAVASEIVKNCGLLCRDIGDAFPFKEESLDCAIGITSDR